MVRRNWRKSSEEPRQVLPGVLPREGLGGGLVSFLTSQKHVVIEAQWLTFPLAMVEIEHTPGFLGKVGIPRKDRASATPSRR